MAISVRQFQRSSSRSALYSIGVPTTISLVPLEPAHSYYLSVTLISLPLCLFLSIAHSLYPCDRPLRVGLAT